MARDKGRTRCESVRDSLPDYLEGRLSAALRGPLRAHLQRCPSCRRAHDRERRLYQLLGDMPRVSAPSSLADSVLAAVFAQVPLRERVAPAPARAVGWRQWTLLPVAILMLGMILGLWMETADRARLQSTAASALVEGSRELSGALSLLEGLRSAADQMSYPVREKAASLLRVERTLRGVLPLGTTFLILLVACGPAVLVFTLYRIRLKGVLSNVLVHPTLR
ncbi:MAG: zf-HC2 domain-containing protein [Candidatus Krumholzibacteriia bacterium]|nr:zf-HC2 domain-containing protein [bacterium]MCB9514469.1 zf-HC2 domain-containing protein [Candidatus Latescibacterota bacterium]MCB9517273.1 zf-HC2 domain-containing protein [Candidatus Latescibacterota bacterium]